LTLNSPSFTVIGPRERNFGDFLSSAAGEFVDGLGLPDTVELTPGALRYLGDLEQRRSD
jgi:CobQ-like glutamine amidotransferase family enzyme